MGLGSQALNGALARHLQPLIRASTQAKETRACTIGKPIDGGYEVLAGFVGGFTTPQTVVELPEPLATGQTLRGERTLTNE